MALPVFSEVTLPLLKFASDGKEHSVKDAEAHLASLFNLSQEERSALKPSGGEALFLHKIRWARTHLKMALLIEDTRIAHFKITQRGQDVLKQSPPAITEKFLCQFPEYEEKRRKKGGLEELIKEFDKNRNFSKVTPEYVTLGEKEREEFIKKFPPDKILDIKLNEYVAGKDPVDRNTFSYQIEFGTSNYGMVQGGSAYKFVIYVKKETQEYWFKDVFSSKDEAFKSVINGIHEIVQATKDFSPDDGDWKKLGQIVEDKKNFINIALRSKILKIYYPEKFFKIWSHKWMNATLDRFGVSRKDLEDNGDFYAKHGRLWDKKRSHPILKEWTPNYFSSFLDEKVLFYHDTETPEIDVIAESTGDLELLEEVEYEKYYDILNRKKQIIFYGPPGTGKTYSANNFSKWIIAKKNGASPVNYKTFIRKVTFHPSYSYEEFVEGIKPKLDTNEMKYEIEDGVFKEICQQARDDPENYYVLIIDEINRGNIPKIFGELITLIENDKREEHFLSLTYSKEEFTVPENLFIIGTMNTADRSLTQLDVALRRRFGFTELMPDYDKVDASIDGINLSTLLKKLNEKIREREGREKQIGHSYFMKNEKPLEDIEDLRFVFINEIIPLFQDYFYEDYEKIQEILGSDFIDLKNLKITSDWKDDLKKFQDNLKKIIGNE